MDRLDAMEREPDAFARSRPLHPRAWRAEIDARLAEAPWFEVEDVVVQMREERNLIASGPATLESLIAYERKFLEAFEPDELSEVARSRLAGTGNWAPKRQGHNPARRARSRRRTSPTSAGRRSSP